VPVAGFAYYPPGELDSHDSRQGRKGDRKVYLPNIIFPLRLAPDQHPHMNSQIFGHGGHGYGGKPDIGGSECDAVNYDPMHQRDDYCEVRAWPMPMCPAGSGHQGQDIRPPSCKDNKWEVVAVVDGLITQVTRNTTVKLRGADGTEYWYLHMHPQSITVKPNQTVKQGDVLGHVSNYDGGDANGTTTHLHFQVRQNIRVDGKVMPVFVPGYTSLIAAYRKAKGLAPGIGPDGNLIVDAQLEIGAPKPPAPSAPPATPPAAPPAPDQPLPNPVPPPTAGPTPPEPVPTTPASDQPAPPTPAAPAPDQPLPSPAPAPPSAGPTPPEPAPTPPASDQPAPPTPTPTAPAPDHPAPGPAPSPQPPSPVPPPTTEQPAPPPQPPASPPTASEQPTQQPAQSWWQKAWNSAKDWWNKGK
jgi:murein DD-endopeptidase MepM/ murein hydrolase activator NlpD